MYEQMKMIECRGKMIVGREGYQNVVVYVDGNFEHEDVFNYEEAKRALEWYGFYEFGATVYLDGKDGFTDNEILKSRFHKYGIQEGKPILFITNMPCYLELIYTWDYYREMFNTFFYLEYGTVKNVQDLTERELHPGHNLYKIYINGDLDV